jgi:hypothetical protein
METRSDSPILANECPGGPRPEITASILLEQSSDFPVAVLQKQDVGKMGA